MSNAVLNAVFCETTKMFIANLIVEVGAKAAGQLLTKEIIMQLLKRVGVRVTAKQVIKHIPLLGQTVAATLSFDAMKFVGDQHVRECYEPAKHIIKSDTNV